MTSPPQARHSDDQIEILLVEDNPADVRLVEEAFEVTDHETTVHTITDGDDAVDFVTQWEPDGSAPALALIDLGLPGRDGCEVLNAIREDSQLRSLPVIVLTSSRDQEDIARCYDATANAYLTKPTDHDEFVSVVQALDRFWFEQVQLPPIPS